MISILNNKIIDHYRKKAKSKENKQTEQQASQAVESMFDENGRWANTAANRVWEDEQELLDNPSFQIIMNKCLSDLPDNWRYALTSKYLNEKNADEICQDLEITPTNYWKIIQRAKLMMKKCIETHWK